MCRITLFWVIFFFFKFLKLIFNDFFSNNELSSCYKLILYPFPVIQGPVLTEIRALTPMEQPILTEMRALTPMEQPILTEMRALTPMEQPILTEMRALTPKEQPLLTEMRALTPMESMKLHVEQSRIMVSRPTSGTSTEGWNSITVPPVTFSSTSFSEL